jgi:putative DNA primase/helicase
MNQIEENDPAGQSGTGATAGGRAKARLQTTQSRTPAKTAARGKTKLPATPKRQAPEVEPTAHTPSAKRTSTTKTKEQPKMQERPSARDASATPEPQAPAPPTARSATPQPQKPEAPSLMASIRRAVTTFVGRSNADGNREANAERTKADAPINPDAAAATPAPGKAKTETSPEQTRVPNGAPNLEKEAVTFVIPHSLQQRYLVSDDKYYFRDRQQALAFEDKGQRIATSHDDAAVARSMVELATAKGWNGIKIKGTEAFKREAWLAASERGLETTGYRPKDADKARLAEIMAERQAQTPAPEPTRNSIERKQLDLPLESGTAATASKATATRQEKQQSEEPALPQHEKKAIDALRGIMQQRGDSQEAIDLTAKLAAEELNNRRSHVGKLVEHGPAPYKHDKDEQPSYYVVLDTPGGVKTVWGVDLKRQFRENPVPIGTDVVVSQAGKQNVTVQAKERDANHKVTGKTVTIDAIKNEWEVSTVDGMRDQAAGRNKSTPARPTAGKEPPAGAPVPVDRPAMSRQSRTQRSAREQEAPTR